MILAYRQQKSPKFATNIDWENVCKEISVGSDTQKTEIWHVEIKLIVDILRVESVTFIIHSGSGFSQTNQTQQPAYRSAR